MTSFVVDTNVAIVANGRSPQADAPCQLACVQRLREVVSQLIVIAIDDLGDIMREYAKHLSYAGQPGVGDMFFRHLFNNQYRSERVRRVQITPSPDEERGFEELPPNSFDPSDRKFLAVAAAAGAVVLNATDSDWHEHEALLESLSVEVQQLCPQHAKKQPSP